MTRLSAASRPALILHGEQDRCVPLGQAQELYAGLREFGVPAEFVTYPREGHQAREPAHVADQRERVLRLSRVAPGGVMKFGLHIPNFGALADPAAVAGLAATAEAAGWDGFFLWDHVARPEGVFPMAEPWIGLAAVAAAPSGSGSARW